MSDDTTADDQEDSQAGEERPALGDDERASFDPGAVEEIAADVEAEVTGADEDENDEIDETPDSNDTDSESSSVDLEDVGASLSWGDMYVESVATLLVVIVDVYSDDADLDADDVVDLAGSGLVDISAQVDRLVAEMGGGTELSPEYAVLLGTALLAVAVLVKETDVAEDLLADAAAGSPLAGGVA